jgi:hypothetical protein
MAKLTGYLAVVALVLGFAGTSMATVYYLDEKIGPGEASGFIQTDGTLGIVGPSNITDWNILINYGSKTFDLLSSNSQLLDTGNGLTATATDLLFDFSAPPAYLQFQNPVLNSGINVLCYNGSVGGCILHQGSVAFGTTGPFLSAPETGDLVIASTTPPVTAREPSTIAVFGIGLLALGLARQGIGRNI